MSWTRKLQNTLNVMTIIFCCSIVAGSYGQTSDLKPGVALMHLSGNIYVAEDTFFFKENSVVYIGKKSVTIISATWTPETAKLLVDEIKKVTDKPIGMIVNTHFHLDRTGGNAYFKKLGSTILASKRTSELMKKNWTQMIKDTRKGFPSYPDVPLVLPDETFGDEYDLEDGKIQLRYFGPSHSEDQIVAYFPDERVLDGDCAIKEQLGNLADANLNEYPKTLEKMKALPIKTIISGHWSPIHDASLIDKMIKMLKNRQVGAAK